MWGPHVVVLVVKGSMIGSGECPRLGLVDWRLDHGAVCIESSLVGCLVWTLEQYG